MNNLKNKIVDNWKMILIIVVVLVILFVGEGVACYMAGARTCKPTAPPVITPDEKPVTIIRRPIVKNYIICGDKIHLAIKAKKKYKFLVTAWDKCKKTEQKFDIDYQCPSHKNQLALSPGLYMTYIADQEKFYLAPGGALEYTRLWGRLGFGGIVQAWSTMDKSMYGVALNVKASFKW